MSKQGLIGISSENMIPIIKKWLYSDKEIFFREIVANAIDAITKYKKLLAIDIASKVDEEFCVKVIIDKKKRTLTISDNGIGMTEDEVEKYISQIAFSGASDFVSKYENCNGEGIIGHFGLGFYSAYMVADNVEIFTKSYTGTPAVRWESDGNSKYIIDNSNKATRGTDIVLHLAQKEKEFLEESTIIGLIRKYCVFMPYNIFIETVGEKPEDEIKKPLNITEPLYLKNPKDCTAEDYDKFYRDTFLEFTPPLFQIHLNMDYPFKLKGILYFPKVNNKFELERGQVKLYCNQVFVADNIKEIIPEFLMLLKGVIDCPDIPLNVSRGFLQNDAEVQKITKHITKKVADKLLSLYTNERNEFIRFWDDIANFVKFGCLKEDSFLDKVSDIIIYKNLDNEYVSIKDIIYGSNPELDEKGNPKVEDKVIYYVSDPVAQAQYIKLFNDAGLNAIICDTFIDPHFMSFVEMKTGCKFARIDSNIDGALKKDDDKVTSKRAEDVTEAFKQAINNKDITIRVESLKNSEITAFINAFEYTRRFNEMSAVSALEMGEEQEQLTLVINLNNKLIYDFVRLNAEKRNVVANYVYYLAMLSYRKLTSHEMSDFIEKSNEMLKFYAF